MREVPFFETGVGLAACWRATMRSMVSSVMELMDALAMASISDSTEFSACPTGVTSAWLPSTGCMSSKREITSIRVSRRALPVKR